MPCHPDRVRTAPLPEGYQFGDGRCRHDYRARRWTVPALDADFYIATCALCGHEAGPVNLSGVQALYGEGRWRPMHENAADRLRRYQTEYEPRLQAIDAMKDGFRRGIHAFDTGSDPGDEA